jgi:3-deoxy-D-manno-octulosonic-acid transferase
MLLYRLFIYCYPPLAKILGLFNPKAKSWCQGQSTVWQEIENKKTGIQKPIIWVHAASYGEFEQGLPIMQVIREKYPNYSIWLTFFSPSGYLHRKDDPAADAITYLPFESLKNANRFIETLNPAFIIFIKYEFWYYYLKAAKNKNIPTLLASSIFREDQIFFKWYGGFYKKIVNLFSSILVQEKISFDLIKPLIADSRLSISGDTRFDRVLQTVKNTHPLHWINLLSEHKTIIAGSTWKEDHLLFSALLPNLKDVNILIAPHLVDANNINDCKKIFPSAITLSAFIAQDTKQTTTQIIIIDSIGILRSLYQYATITYVGGAFGYDGVHNVLEPAAFGKPVIWGPNDKKYREAIGLREAKGGFSIADYKEALSLIDTLLKNESAYQNACVAAAEYIKTHAGAIDKTMTEIIHYLG